MAVLRENPYGEFNFLVDLGSGDTDGPEAGFAEVSGLEQSVEVIEYRNGNDKLNSVRKLSGLNKVGDVTLKRGIIGSLVLYQWLNAVRNGEQGVTRTVRIHLQSEDRSGIVMSWTLLRARPVRQVHGPLGAKGSDVAMEELTLAYERLEIE
jgi:phage tail-like protein